MNRIPERTEGTRAGWKVRCLVSECLHSSATAGPELRRHPLPQLPRALGCGRSRSASLRRRPRRDRLRELSGPGGEPNAPGITAPSGSFGQAPDQPSWSTGIQGEPASGSSQRSLTSARSSARKRAQSARISSVTNSPGSAGSDCGSRVSVQGRSELHPPTSVTRTGMSGRFLAKSAKFALYVTQLQLAL